MSDVIIEKAIQYITELFCGNSDGHDVEHTLRVYHNAMCIAADEPDCDQEIIALSALLHDADDHKLFNTKNNSNAKDFLKEHKIPEKTIDEICEVINAVSFSQNKGHVPGTVEGRIVQDADRLDALGAIGIARTFAYGGEHHRPLRESIRHFYDKLLLLKELMNTETGKQLAERRHKYLEMFLEELDEEMDEGMSV